MPFLLALTAAGQAEQRVIALALKEKSYMLISNKDAVSRLASSNNLINRLNNSFKSSGSSSKFSGKAMSLFGVGIHYPETPKQQGMEFVTNNNSHKEDKGTKEAQELSESAESPKIDEFLTSADSKIRLSLAHDKALEVLNQAVDMMQLKLDDIKPDKLPSVISATSKVVDQIQRQRIDASKNEKNADVHFHFYTPEQKNIEQYEVIEIN